MSINKPCTTVLIIDDSAFMRKMIGDLLEQDERIRVVGKARNGADGVEQIKNLNPDVVTLDVEMPVMDGLEALKIIMRQCPTPVIMVSSTTQKGAETTMEAMNIGAFDFISKPSGPISLDIHKVQKLLIEKVISASSTQISKLKTVFSQAPPLDNTIVDRIQKQENNKTPMPVAEDLDRTIVAIGTSTGGPRALQKILTQLPANFPYPILIVQHMPPGFTKSLSSRLASLSAIQVKEAEDGEILNKGIAYVAPGGYHLKVARSGSLVVVLLDDKSEALNGHRPSVDALFYSLAALQRVNVLSVVLTGMGADGAKGLIQLKQRGNTVAIAESEQTAVVYGMPKAAIAEKVVDHIIPLDEVTTAILSYSSRGGKTSG